MCGLHHYLHSLLATAFLLLPGVADDDLDQQLITAARNGRTEEVLRLLSPETTAGKLAAAAALMLFIPAIAYVYGTFARTLLKLARIE